MDIVKRNGASERFDILKIQQAVRKSLIEVGETDSFVKSGKIADAVGNIVRQKLQNPTVEQVQDLVEQQLMAFGEFAAAKAYILYRKKHEELRDEYALTPEEAAKVRESRKYFQTELQAFQFMDKYARWHPGAGRRETWDETVARVMRFFMSEVGVDALDSATWTELKDAMLNMQAFPSMRVMQMAGPALERCHVGVYNCAYVELSSLKAFSELLYVMMQGTGCGFSVETEVVEHLPRIKRQAKGTFVVKHVIPDTTEGWCDALYVGLSAWHNGRDVEFDYSQIRPQGAVLKTKGGRASGPEPLKRLLSFVRDKVLSRQGACLTTIDAHDIACLCGDIVQVGGVRRAAEISLSDLDDADMRRAKDHTELFTTVDGKVVVKNGQRFMANNSAVYTAKPSAVEFMEEWLSLAKSGTGERGIFNREGVLKQIPKRRKKARFGVNPCGEIMLRNKQFCNLSIAIARADDTYESLANKVRLAAIFGTLQSTLTRFSYLSDDWKKNCEEERLLGVDITGQMDCPLLRPDMGYGSESDGNRGPRQDLLTILRQIAINTNRELAAKLGINPSAAVTCVKPSGNSSVLFNCSSGLHARHSPFYVRRVRIGAFGPIARVFKDAGVPLIPEVGHDPDNPSVYVVEFPVKSPEGAVLVKDLKAIDQLENWLDLKRFYTEHNPSCTIYVEPHEWIEVGHWVYKNWDYIGGLSFLPRDGGAYQLPPYSEITEEEYEARAAALPEVDYSKMARYERQDMTTSAQEYACVAGNCEV